MNLHNISTISRYETRLLRRGWLFRIFAILSLVTVTGCHVIFQSNMFNAQWDMTAMSCSIPFVNTYIFNIAQSIIAIFLAGSFLKRDKKLDTAEVIYVHPMSNADYIVGKTWGIIQVFVGLNLVGMAIAMLIHFFASDSSFSVYPYFFYLFTLSLPSLIFVLGLSFVIMSLTRNQAVTFVVMLGFIGVTLFYLGDVEHGAFDFFAMTLPNIFSDVVGHADLKPYLTQRLAFLLLGIALLIFTIVMVQRLPLHPRKNVWLRIAACVVLLGGAGFLYEYVGHFQEIKSRREVYVDTYRKYSQEKRGSLLRQQLSYAQRDGRMRAEALLTVQNRQREVLDRLVFYLNPLLQVTEITQDGRPVEFEREEQAVVVKLSLRPDEVATLRMAYEGGVDENICYVDVNDEDFYNTVNGNTTLRFGKHYAFLDKRFTLLTPEVLWYPVCQPPVNPENPYNLRKDFTEYVLRVANPEGRTVLSQGKETVSGDTVVFVNETRLPGISLAIGDYEKKSIEVDSTEFAFYVFEGHDIYSDVFVEIQDTLEGFIRDLKTDYELRKGRKYPFRRFALTETPVSFAGYVRNWKGNSEQIQPEYVFLNEWGVTLDANMKAQKKLYTKWMQEREGESAEPLDIELRVLRGFVQWNLQEETMREVEGSMILNMATRDWDVTTMLNPYDISALFFNYSNSTYSKDFPIMDVVLNIMQKQEDNDPGRRWRRMFSGMSDAQRAAIYLDGKSFEQAIQDKELSQVIFYEMLKLKANYLKNYVTSKIPAKEFKQFMSDFAEAHRFSETTFSELNKEFVEKFHFNLMDLIPGWYTSTKIPVILVKGTAAEEVSIDERTKYVVHFYVHNPTDCEAVISVEIEERRGGPRGGRGGGFGAEEEELPTNYIIGPNEYKEIRMLCDERPNNMVINTNIAQNIPSEVMQNFQKIEEMSTDTTTGIFDIDESVFMLGSDEIVVDNEDKGFRVIEANQKNKLQNLFRKESEDKYKNLNFWSPPTRWTATVGISFYGDYINSCMYKKVGSGNNKAEWTAKIPESGYYEVYVYVPQAPGPRWMNREENFQYYTVKHDDGEEEISVKMTGPGSEGWFMPGSFYFSEGDATVTLSDKGSGARQLIYADAVKWVYANNNK